MSNLNDGEVVITLGNDTYILRPTLNVIKKLSRLYGGLAPIWKKLIDQDFDTIVKVVMIGADIPDRDEDSIAGKIYRAGLASPAVIDPIVEHLRVVLNGGRSVKDTPDEPPAEASEGNA